MTVTQIIHKFAVELDAINRELATNCDAPAQRIINAGFAHMGLERFDRSGNDLWERITCAQNGWEYEKPPAHLAARWARY